MKRFRFPLRPVAVLRAHRQARARAAFAAAAHAYVQAEEALAALRSQRDEYEAILHDGRRTTFQASDEVSFWAAYRRLCAEQINAERVMIEARATMHLSREAYLEAHREVRVVEKLEQKARTTHRLEGERAAQSELDELAGLRIARRLAAASATAP